MLTNQLYIAAVYEVNYGNVPVKNVIERLGVVTSIITTEMEDEVQQEEDPELGMENTPEKRFEDFIMREEPEPIPSQPKKLDLRNRIQQQTRLQPAGADKHSDKHSGNDRQTDSAISLCSSEENEHSASADKKKKRRRRLKS